MFVLFLKDGFDLELWLLKTESKKELLIHSE